MVLLSKPMSCYFAFHKTALFTSKRIPEIPRLSEKFLTVFSLRKIDYSICDHVLKILSHKIDKMLGKTSH